jgi:hypothetical protein
MQEVLKASVSARTFQFSLLAALDKNSSLIFRMLD